MLFSIGIGVVSKPTGEVEEAQEDDQCVSVFGFAATVARLTSLRTDELWLVQRNVPYSCGQMGNGDRSDINIFYYKQFEEKKKYPSVFCRKKLFRSPALLLIRTGYLLSCKLINENLYKNFLKCIIKKLFNLCVCVCVCDNYFQSSYQFRVSYRIIDKMNINEVLHNV